MTASEEPRPTEQPADRRGQAADALEALARGEPTGPAEQIPEPNAELSLELNADGGADPLAEAIAAEMEILSPAEGTAEATDLAAELADLPAEWANLPAPDGSSMARLRRRNAAERAHFALSFRRVALPMMAIMALLMLIIAGWSLATAVGGHLVAARATVAWLIAVCCLGVAAVMIAGCYVFWRDIQQAGPRQRRGRRPF